MRIALYNHYPAPLSFEQDSLLPALRKAVRELEEKGLVKEGAAFLELEGIEINLVDDPTIAAVHEEFMEDPTPTDVITFHHGEVFVSYDTALREAEQRAIPLREELLRYHLHGILHLAGYDDLTESDYAVMHEVQEHLVEHYAPHGQGK